MKSDYDTNQRHDEVRPIRKTAAEKNDGDPSGLRQNAEAECSPVNNLRASAACETTCGDSSSGDSKK